MAWENEDIVNRLRELREWYLAMMEAEREKEEE